ncbi:hypothetical protein [Sansalvadorimonas verongulae]|uniref:hypothetical protein n=1 Tax=Sansalvadorimonas verongulae TaxID=2172824 RepID=UPI0012BCA6FB|nr:hypothetical protein [Sansalvadorimonas verongulae]
MEPSTTDHIILTMSIVFPVMYCVALIVSLQMDTRHDQADTQPQLARTKKPVR